MFSMHKPDKGRIVFDLRYWQNMCIQCISINHVIFYVNRLEILTQSLINKYNIITYLFDVLSVYNIIIF